MTNQKLPTEVRSLSFKMLKKYWNIFVNRVQSDLPMTWHKVTTCLPGQPPYIVYTKAEIQLQANFIQKASKCLFHFKRIYCLI